jgi:hypothetical protein
MARSGGKSNSNRNREKQLQGIAVRTVLQKRRLDQALNVKEFAVCAGLSYSTARQWFRIPGFPTVRGVIFWKDFVRWRAEQNGFSSPTCAVPSRTEDQPRDNDNTTDVSTLPLRAQWILLNS